MMTLRMTFALSLLPLLIAGCNLGTILETDKVDYKTAGRLPALEIPPDLTRPTSDDTYAVPDINPRSQATFSAYSRDRAATGGDGRATVLPPQENAHIERAGDQRWLVVKGDANVVWDVVRDFWQEVGFIIDTENPDAGVMETDWIDRSTKIPDSNPIRALLAKALRSTPIGTTGGPAAMRERLKFRTRLERGAVPGTMEIYVSHRGMEEVPTASDKVETWKPRPPDPDLEAEMLAKLMVHFGVKPAPAQLEAVGVQLPARAKLLKGVDGTGMLSVSDQFDRAWRRVGLALDRVGFTVEDRDRSKGLYFVRYADPDAGQKAAQSKGFFARLNPFSSSDKKPGSDQFRIQVKGDDSASQVNVLGKDGNEEKSDTASRILALLYEQLK